MKMKMEVPSGEQKVLIIDKHSTQLSSQIKDELVKFDVTVYLSPEFPQNIDNFNYCFVINPKELSNKLHNTHNIKVLYIFFNSQKKVQKYIATLTNHRIKHTKIVHIIGDVNISMDTLNNMLWFILTNSPETLLTINQQIPQKLYKSQRSHIKIPPKLSVIDLFVKIRYRTILLTLFIVFIMYHLLFIPPLIIGSYLTYQGSKQLTSFQIDKAQYTIRTAAPFINLSKSLYVFPRGTFQFFSLAHYVDAIFQIDDNTTSIIYKSVILQKQSKSILTLLIKKDKTMDEIKQLTGQIQSLKQSINQLFDYVVILNQKISNLPYQSLTLKDRLLKLSESLQKIKSMYTTLDYLFEPNKEKKFLLLFANNMELRPGGGFIGSFGILTINDLTLKDLAIYDVYDADGQLIAHIEPPPAIKKYLGQPHWFLRDSGFSGNFPQDYQQAQFFLEKELGMTNFSGGILITTTAIQNILSAYGSIYIPDFQELVTPENFYLKAQIHAEKDFFPGSTQKKSFLGSLARYAIANVDQISPLTFTQQIKKSLDEKQMVVQIDDPKVQESLNKLYWSGRLVEPNCPPNLDNCIPDYFMPIEANLGVNKANFFVTRSIDMDITIAPDGSLNTIATLLFKNNSERDVFPGGLYRNYMQVLLPANALVNRVTKNGVLIEDLVVSTDQYRHIGFYFEIPPQQSSLIRIEYQTTVKLQRGKAYYQLLIQKQIGLPTSNLSIKFKLPKNVYLLNQNFSPLVKDDRILYNTQLAADKIFFIELLKE